MEGKMPGKVEGFRKLEVWKKSYDLTLEIYRLTKTFPKEEAYGLISQMQRAAVSVTANIAEGYERNHRKEYVQFLFISKGSLGELETFLMLARDLGYVSPELYASAEQIRKDSTRLLTGLIRSLS
jgi:four helix bundle protein